MSKGLIGINSLIRGMLRLLDKGLIVITGVLCGLVALIGKVLTLIKTKIDKRAQPVTARLREMPLFIGRHWAFFTVLSTMTALVFLKAETIFAEMQTGGAAAGPINLVTCAFLFFYVFGASVCLTCFCHNRINSLPLVPCCFTALCLIVQLAFQLLVNGFDGNFEATLPFALFCLIVSLPASVLASTILDKPKHKGVVCIAYILIAQSLLWGMCMVLLEAWFPYR